MALFSRKTDIEKNSLAAAYNRLLASNGLPAIPVPLYDGYVQLVELGYLGTWPNTNNSIIKFQYQSIEQPYLENGEERTANIIDIYCQTADFQDHTIVDPSDGTIKSPGFYGSPTGWVSYEDAPAPQPVKKNRVRSGRNYEVDDGETIWEIARKLNYTAEELIEHNDIEDPQNLPAGTVLRLPYSLPAEPEVAPIHYEILDAPLKMHISKTHGAKKWSFGNVTSWKDVKSTGPTFPLGTLVDVVAIAHVPVGDETAAYYMDATALGNYGETGRPAYTIGFNHSHLTEGPYEPAPAPQPEPEPEVVPDAPQPGLAQLPTTEIDMREPDISKPPFTSSYVHFDKPVSYVAHERMWVKDLSGRRPDRELLANQDVVIAGTFIKDDVLYGRPTGAAKNFLWFGVPMSNLISEAELYNTDVALAEKVALRNGVLTPAERGVVALSKVLSQGIKIKAYFGKIKTKIKE